jgi:P27 family predicted phage terminase small subunit
VGRRGPAPAPTELQIARGETRPSRINHNEPELPAPSTLQAPKGLIGPGRQEWEKVAPQLSKAGVLRDTDRTALEDYCRTLTELRGYEDAAKKAGPEFAIAKGYQGMVIKLRAQCSQLRQQLGLTPSSRAGVKADWKPSQPNLDEEMFGGPRGVVRRGA